MNEEQFRELITVREGIYLEDLNIDDLSLDLFKTLLLITYRDYYYHLYYQDSKLHLILYKLDAGLKVFDKYTKLNYTLTGDLYKDLIDRLNSNIAVHYKNSDFTLLSLLKKRGLYLPFSDIYIPTDNLFTHSDF